MTLWCCITPERVDKTTRIMEALAQGWPGAEVVAGRPPDDGEPFIVWGQRFLAAQIIPPALAAGRPFWHVDNGYWLSAKGHTYGYYRITYRGLSPVFLPDAPERPLLAPCIMRPWRRDGHHVVLALPGDGFGAMLGFDMGAWIAGAAEAVRRHTNRRVIVRPKNSPVPLASNLGGAWALVTHSSNVAVDAVLAGIPVFVAPTSPAAPVGNLDLADIEAPMVPDRSAWLRSLVAQQFTLGEMRDGTAYRLLSAARKWVDDGVQD